MLLKCDNAAGDAFSGVTGWLAGQVVRVGVNDDCFANDVGYALTDGDLVGRDGVHCFLAGEGGDVA